MATVLITGGSGYFGCLLRDRLRETGASVRIFDVVDVEDRPSEVEFIRGDIRDLDAVRRACANVEVVYHNVAQVPLAKDRHLFWAVNCGGTENLLHAARDARVRKVVHTSSSAVFGVPARNPVDDTVAPNPMEAYGRAKLEAERVVQRYVGEHGLDVSIIRPRTILGHGRLGIFQILFDWIEEGKNIPVLGRGDNIYQFVHADDLAAASIKAAARPGFGIYNIGAETFGTMRATLEALCRHAATGSQVYSVPMGLAIAAMKLTSALRLSPLGPYHSLMYGRSLYFDITRPKAELDWQPRWSSDEMICESYDWYLGHKQQVLHSSGASHHRSAVKQGILKLVKQFS
ncbi:MAG: NAD-dependent epimerase/dehydratase family protein [Deltaproteobacteria bacterium]|nr:NAD-dependent epimerase/dehydratase family protein [Deltaproteobacteria bacterium]MBI3391490.1 NAD-dependent epimerase/dehydratase family protein [Deltaproteobacteria bacterium]